MVIRDRQIIAKRQERLMSGLDFEISLVVDIRNLAMLDDPFKANKITKAGLKLRFHP